MKNNKFALFTGLILALITFSFLLTTCGPIEGSLESVMAKAGVGTQEEGEGGGDGLDDDFPNNGVDSKYWGTYESDAFENLNYSGGPFWNQFILYETSLSISTFYVSDNSLMGNSSYDLSSSFGSITRYEGDILGDWAYLYENGKKEYLGIVVYFNEYEDDGDGFFYNGSIILGAHYVDSLISELPILGIRCDRLPITNNMQKVLNTEGLRYY
ncbi:MAG: hypothetical protein FWH35_07810 [Treponema sp.]|nr:hypothetical protein [Treponema sp.]